MKISPAAELGMQGVLVLAENFGQGPTTLAEICEMRSLSREYLAKVFGQLARMDIVTPVRGKKGGYVLARDPKDVTLLQIIEAIEGVQALNLCQYDPPRCDNASVCKVQPVWSELQEIITAKLNSLNLADCI